MGKTRKFDTDRIGRNEALAAQLRNRPNGFMEHKPKRQRTRRDDKRNAIRDSVRNY